MESDCLSDLLSADNEDDSGAESHKDDDPHTADGDDVSDDVAGGDDDGADAGVELEPVEGVEEGDGRGHSEHRVGPHDLGGVHGGRILRNLPMHAGYLIPKQLT